MTIKPYISPLLSMLIDCMQSEPVTLTLTRTHMHTPLPKHTIPPHTHTHTHGRTWSVFILVERFEWPCSSSSSSSRCAAESGWEAKGVQSVHRPETTPAASDLNALSLASSLSPSLSLSLSPSLSPRLSLSLPLPVSLSPFSRLSLPLCVCFFRSLRPSPSLSLYFSFFGLLRIFNLVRIRIVNWDHFVLAGK